MDSIETVHLFVELARGNGVSAGFFAARSCADYSDDVPDDLFRISLEAERNIRAFGSGSV